MIPTTPRALLLSAALLFTPTILRAQDDPTIPADNDPRTTDSGLQFDVLKAGEPGDMPGMGDKVKVHYTGWLTDGKVFDSSRRRGAPAEFVLGQVIAGWNEGLALMTPGTVAKLTIPYDLAYGEQGRPPTIPAKATLIFEVELISFVAGPKFRQPDPGAQKTTASGLKYEVLVAGEGDAPKADDMVELQYSLWNTDGQLLDTSIFSPRPTKAMPEQFSIGLLKEAPLLMKPGSRYLFEVPPELAFGQQDRGAQLPAGSTTIWELQLVQVFSVTVPDFVMPAPADLVETASGLKYQVVKEGSGESPRPSQRVTVNYAGWLTDGTPFDNSFARGEPSQFGVGQVIRGWTEGLQLMNRGAIYRFVIPGDLAYGERGSPPKIGPNATLVFHVELIDFN